VNVKPGLVWVIGSFRVDRDVQESLEQLRLSFAEGRSLGALAPLTSAFCDLCRRDRLHHQLDIVTAAKVCTSTTEPLLYQDS